MNEELEKAIFTGDTLLTGGCGKFIEGDAKDMYNVLYNILGQLPRDTKVYCGHECGLNNLQFANTIDPNNQYIRKQLAYSQINQITVPSILEDELKYNPYLRLSETSIQQATNVTDPYEVMHVLRMLNDNFNNQSNGINGISNGVNGVNGVNNRVNGVSNGVNGISNGVNGMSNMNGISGITVL